MRYCARCIIPSTRPHIEFDASGICNACLAHELKSRIDWVQRARDFRAIVEEVKALKRPYDCLIPVSGGKDSTWQVVTCLQLGLHPLAVTWRPPARTAIGARNLDNLVRLGVDHLDVQINPRVERTFLSQALIRFGAPAIPMHLAMFNIPFTLAVKLQIPLVVWGENSAFEYGGREEDRYGSELDAAWVRRYGVTHGTTAEDWVSKGLTRQDLTLYFGPTEAELRATGIRAVFLGYYLPWDPATSWAVARAHGFEADPGGPRIGYYQFADLDDEFVSVHHYLKWYKFGFTRSFDNLSIEIRHGRLTRQEAIQVVRERGDEFPAGDIERFCAFVGLSTREFFELIERFRNPEIWVRRNGVWMVEDFLVPDWPWRSSEMMEVGGR